MTQLDSQYTAGDTVRIPASARTDQDGNLIAGITGANITIINADTGAEIISNAAMSPEPNLTGSFYYNLINAVAGNKRYRVTYSDGYKTGDGFFTVGSGTAVSQSDLDTIKNISGSSGYDQTTDSLEAIAAQTQQMTFSAGFIQARNEDGEKIANDTDLQAVLADTDELQSNQVNADITTLLTNIDILLVRLTALRAGYLDKLNVAGILANTDNAELFQESSSVDLTGIALEATVQAVKTKTDNLPSDPASQSAEVDIGKVKGVPVSGIADFKAVLTGVATSDQIAALNNLSLSQVVNGILDEMLSGHVTSGTTGAKLNSLNTSNLDAAVSSRLASVDYTTPPDISGLALEASVQAVKAITDMLSGMVENVSGNRFTAKALEEAPAADLTGATVTLDSEAIVPGVHTALDTYTPDPEPGVTPVIIPPPVSQIKVYFLCYDTDGVTPLESVTATLQLLDRPTVYNERGHDVRAVVGEYIPETGIQSWKIPPGSKVRVTIFECGVDRTGYPGNTGGVSIRADEIPLEESE